MARLVLPLLLCLAAAMAVQGREKPRGQAGGDEDIAGPVVKPSQRIDILHSSANLTVTANGTLPEEKKKTIAQILDEALEQEFPEEKAEKIGKNYNETAKQEDVRASCSCLPACVHPETDLTQCHLFSKFSRPRNALTEHHCMSRRPWRR